MTDSLERLKIALLGRYSIDRKVGEGGMAVVYLAEDLKHRRSVALKVLRREFAAALGSERFLREIEIAARLSHPHIMALLDSGDADGFLFYVMPFVDGDTLRDRLKREKQLALDDVVQITREVASALQHAHDLGIVHRDVKPENILLSEGGSVLADFGIARVIDSAQRASQSSQLTAITATGLAVGTPNYMSPEQATGTARVDGRSDVYALACVVYEMLGGEPPYTGPTPKAILARQLAAEVRPLHPIRTVVTPDFDAVLRRALDPTPADRYQTAAQFARAIRRRASTRKIRVSVDKVRRVGRQVPLRSALVAGGLLLVGIVATLLGFLVLPELRASEEPSSLVIFPFRSTGEEALGEAVADLLAATLDGTVGVRVADPATMWATLERDDDDVVRPPALEQALALARRVSASSVMLGSVTAAAGAAVVSGRVYDGDGDLVATLRASVPADSLGAAVNRLAIDIVSAVWTSDTLPSVPSIEELATDDVEALKAYLEAKSLRRQGRTMEAEAAIERAVALDSTFALAYVEQFQIKSWNQFQNVQPYTGLRQIINQAMAHRERLSPRNRLLVEANLALDQTDGILAASLFERILEIDSVDMDARQGLAFALLRDGWQMDKGPDEVVAAYERILDIDSTQSATLAMLARLALWNQDDDLLASSVDRLVQLDTSSAIALGTLATVRAIQSGPAERDSILRANASQPVPVASTVLRDLRTLRPELAERFFDELAVDTMPVFHQRMAAGARMQLWLGEGRVRAADSVVRAGDVNAIRGVMNGYFVAAALAGVGDSSSTARAVRELSEYVEPSTIDSMIRAGQFAWMEGWALASYHATLGDTARAREWQRAFAELPSGDTSWDWTGALVADTEARLAARRGDLEAAEREARHAFDTWSIHSNNVNDAHPEPGMRFHLAEILRARGRSVEASRLYRSFAPPHNWAAFYTARSSYELGVLAEESGDYSGAASRYQLALALWELGGPEVSDWRQRASDGLQRAVRRIG